MMKCTSCEIPRKQCDASCYSSLIFASTWHHSQNFYGIVLHNVQLGKACRMDGKGREVAYRWKAGERQRENKTLTKLPETVLDLDASHVVYQCHAIDFSRQLSTHGFEWVNWKISSSATQYSRLFSDNVSDV